MTSQNPALSRRRFICSTTGVIGIASTGLISPAFAAGRVVTPSQTAGPFYPKELPLDSDNDLARVGANGGRPTGQITHLSGRILDASGKPINGARVEIWQANAFGRYLHPRDTRNAPLDPNFQGYGQMTTGVDGRYRFRTIKPVPYSFRTPHIHFAVSGSGYRRLITQMYVAGEARNASDRLLNRIGDADLRAALIVPFTPSPAVESESLSGTFDIVLVNGG